MSMGILKALSTSGPTIVKPSSHTNCVIDGEVMTSSGVDNVICGGEGGDNCLVCQSGKYARFREVLPRAS